ncbi:hypothetical protein QVD17_25393 [Tagetes erecta]|uniref:Uncharacterized protein n=1 Tax=Tagetes erecta TaxID=13708 RepID=A0AAD8KGA4_TARER|nr:hypothetical protein QVD17_25393 [Tagetes erecta]
MVFVVKRYLYRTPDILGLSYVSSGFHIHLPLIEHSTIRGFFYQSQNDTPTLQRTSDVRLDSSPDILG